MLGTFLDVDLSHSLQIKLSLIPPLISEFARSPSLILSSRTKLFHSFLEKEGKKNALYIAMCIPYDFAQNPCKILDCNLFNVSGFVSIYLLFLLSSIFTWFLINFVLCYDD